MKLLFVFLLLLTVNAQARILSDEKRAFYACDSIAMKSFYDPDSTITDMQITYHNKKTQLWSVKIFYRTKNIFNDSVPVDIECLVKIKKDNEDVISINSV